MYLEYFYIFWEREESEEHIKNANKYGVVSETIFPYESQPPYPEPDTLRDRDRHYQGRINYRRVPNGDIDIVRMCLSEGMPIIFGFDIYESFHKKTLWNNDGVMPLPQKGERYLGTQAGVIVGYSRKKKAVIVRNSWGPHWKNNGHFFLPYSYLLSKSCGTMWTIDIENEPDFEHIKDRTRSKRRKQKEEQQKSESEEEEEEQEEVPEGMTIDLSGCAIKE